MKIKNIPPKMHADFFSLQGRAERFTQFSRVISSHFFLFFFIILSFGLWFPPAAFADELPQQVYELQLEYNPLKGNIIIDKRAQSAYRLLSGTTSFPTSPRFSEYFGSVSTVSGKVLLEFGFSRPPVVETGALAPLLLRVPYFPNATRIDLFQGSTIFLSFDVSPSLLCRENTQCERDSGETPENCPADCEAMLVPPAPPREDVPSPTSIEVTEGALPPTAEVSTELPSEQDPLPMLSLLFLSLGILSFGGWMYLRWRNRE